MSKLHGLRPSACANGITLAMFTVFPVIMFSTILILKLRSNYLQEIDHLQASVNRLGLQANTCLAEQEVRIKRLHLLEAYQIKCRDTLGKASSTLSSLNAAFRLQWDRSDKAVNEAKNNSQSRYKYIQEVDEKVNLTHELVSQNALLRDEVSELHSRLNNVTHSKMFLEGQLGKVKTDLDGLKSNTSRLEGEKKGLEKVLEVKTEVESENKLAGSVLEKAIDLKKEKKKIIGTVKKLLKKNKKKDDEDDDDLDELDEDEDEDDDELMMKKNKKSKKVKDDLDDELDLDDDSDDAETKHKVNKKKKKKEKESIEKIVKEHIEKLGLVSANGTKTQPPLQLQQQPVVQQLQAPPLQQLPVLPVQQPQQLPNIIPNAILAASLPRSQAVPQAQPQQPQAPVVPPLPIVNVPDNINNPKVIPSPATQPAVATDAATIINTTPAPVTQAPPPS